MKYLLALFLVIYGANAVKLAPTIKLNTGYEMPVIGLGTFRAHGQEVQDAVRYALEIGYRHIDTASDYGNEKDIGVAISKAFHDGVLKREELFITTKVWLGGSSRKHALEEIHQSLTNLNVTYLDLVLLHFPGQGDVDVYKGVEDAYNQKLVRSIGISNFDPTQAQNLLKQTTVKPSNNQVSLNPRNAQDQTVEFCKKEGISVTAYSPLGTGSLVNDATLAAIGKKHNKSAAQVALRWEVQRGLIVIPKSTHKNYIKEDFEIFDFTLTDDEMKQIHH